MQDVVYFHNLILIFSSPSAGFYITHKNRLQQIFHNNRENHNLNRLPQSQQASIGCTDQKPSPPTTSHYFIKRSLSTDFESQNTTTTIGMAVIPFTRDNYYPERLKARMRKMPEGELEEPYTENQFNKSTITYEEVLAMVTATDVGTRAARRREANELMRRGVEMQAAMEEATRRSEQLTERARRLGDRVAAYLELISARPA